MGSGNIVMQTGQSQGGAGGNYTILVGSGDVGQGGNITTVAGNSTDAEGLGGVVAISAGAAFGNSSCVDIEYECGSETLTSATYEAIRKGCDRGDLYGLTGSGFTCQGVSVTQTQFDAAQGRCTQKCLGGAVEIAAGYSNGGHGGHVRLSGGESNSTNTETHAGHVLVVGGSSARGVGGSVLVSSGLGTQLSSGDVVVRSEMSGPTGVSGAVSVQTGTASNGSSGGISLTTGQSENGSGGDIALSVGKGDTGAGGDIDLDAGETTSQDGEGGSIFLRAGAAVAGTGGKVNVFGGYSDSGSGGEVRLTAGNSKDGDGGDLVLDAGDSQTAQEGYVRIASNVASYVRIGRSAAKQVPVDIFGDVTIHGNVKTTNIMQFQSEYATRVEITATQNIMAQKELRVPLITGLDTEDHPTNDPTSSLTLEAGLGGDDQKIIIAPGVARAVEVGGRVGAPILLRQGYGTDADKTDARFDVDTYGAVTISSAGDYLNSTTTSAGTLHGNTEAHGQDVTIQTGKNTCSFRSSPSGLCHSGNIVMRTGQSQGGAGGNYTILVGSGDVGQGGNITAVAGNSTDAEGLGGVVAISAH